MKSTCIFLSYAAEHKAVAERIAFSLRGSGFTVFLDKDDLPTGASYDGQIREAIGSSNAFVFLVSPEAVSEGRYTLSELKFAREKWPNPSRAILPVMVAPTDMDRLPEYLKAVTILVPHGNVAAEVNAALARMTRSVRRLTGIATACVAILAAILCLFLMQRARERVSISIGLSSSQPTESAASPGGDSQMKATYAESGENGLPRIGYRVPYLDLLKSGGPVRGVKIARGAFDWQFPALSVKLVNNTSRTVFLSSAAVTVLSSEVDTEPVPVFGSRSMNSIQIDNDGWGDVVNPVLEIAVSEPGAGNATDAAASEKKTIQRPTFSTHDNIRLTPFVPVNLADRDAVAVSGAMTYGPLEKRKSLKFETTVLLDIKAGQATPPTFSYPPAFFEAGKAPASFVVPIEQTVKAGDSDHFLMTFGTDKTSRNRLSISFKTTTGEVLPAGEFLLDLFAPRRKGGNLSTAKPIPAKDAGKGGPPATASAEPDRAANPPVNPAPVKPPAKSPAKSPADDARIVDPDDPRYEGESVDAGARLSTLLTGEAMIILLNEDLMTPKDARIRNAIPLKPEALLEFIRFALGAGIDSTTMADVFDGRSAHSISLNKPALDSDTFNYWDPWGVGSFLTKENNQAGVDAKPHPKERRSWLVKGDELERVLYAVVLPEEGAIHLFHLMPLLDGPADLLVANLRAEQKNDPKAAWLAEARLRNIAAYLRDRKAYGPALSMDRGIAALYPASAGAARELSQGYKDAGQSPPAPASEPSSASPRQAELLADVTGGEFFSFFNLKQEGAEKYAKTGNRALVFRPTGEKFHDLAALILIVAPDNRVIEHRLVLARSFIDDPQQGIFARDIAKSLLTAALDEDDREAAHELIEEIWGQGSREAAIPAAWRADVKIPTLVSQGYAVFLGKRPEYRERFLSSSVALSNSQAGTPYLWITVTRDL